MTLMRNLWIPRNHFEVWKKCQSIQTIRDRVSLRYDFLLQFLKM